VETAGRSSESFESPGSAPTKKEAEGRAAEVAYERLTAVQEEVINEASSRPAEGIYGVVDSISAPSDTASILGAVLDEASAVPSVTSSLMNGDDDELTQLYQTLRNIEDSKSLFEDWGVAGVEDLRLLDEDDVQCLCKFLKKVPAAKLQRCLGLGNK